jgi:ribosomal protein S18 acetylase RimI-like enzyme
MQPLAFRRASQSDAGAIAALVNACYRGETSRRGWTSEADLLDGTRTDRAEIEALVAEADSMILVCLRQEEIIGSIHLKLEGQACYLGMLVVSPELQRGGVGKWIMRAAEELAQQTWGVTTMTMTVISSRHELLAYYERRGYKRTGVTKPFEEDGIHGTPRVAGLTFTLLEKHLGVTDAYDR